jgi:capsid protein
VDLAPGEDISIANPSRPNAAFDPFVRAILQQVGVALEIPHEVLIKSFQASYSASRASILEAWKFYRGRRRWLVRTLCQPCYEDVISEAVARGMLIAPGFFESPLIRRAWLGSVWTGDAMPQIDPLKEASAAQLRINTGTSTIDRESRESNGTTFLENHMQRRKEARMRKADGLDVEVFAEAISTETAALPERTDGGEDQQNDDDSPDTDAEGQRRLPAGAAS